MLNSLDFDWAPRQQLLSPEPDNASPTSGAIWEQMFNEFLEFFKIHGHYDVPQRWKANPQLAAWVSGQRAAHRRGNLASEYVQRLNTVGFRWEPFAEKWDEMYEGLSRFHREFGHTRVPQKWKQNRRLGHWVAVQRRQKTLNLLSKDRISKLELLEFEWNPGRGGGRRGLRMSAWEKMFTQLEEFFAQKGHANVAQQYKANRKLGGWVSTQRQNRRKNKLTGEQIVRLDALNFAWSPMNVGRPHQPKLKRATAPKADQWEEMLGALKAFKAQNGHCRVPQRFKDNARLADWVSRLRMSRNNGTLPTEQEQVLTDLGFDWNPVRNRWDYMFDQLVEYKKEHGHTNVPQRSRKYLQLSHWIRNQRAAKRYNRPIIAERGRRLDEIGFVWRLIDPLSWESMFENLAEFKKVYGHCNVPQHWKENKRLGKWVNTQRTAYKRGKLPPAKQKLLEEIGFAWRMAPTNKRLVPLSTSVAA